MTEETTVEQNTRLAQVRTLRFFGIKCAQKLKSDEAESLYWQAFRLHEEVLGPDAPGIAESLNQIIFFYGTQWRRTEAEPLIERSIALLRQKQGSKHTGVLQTLDGLANHAHRLRHYEDAEAYYKQVLKVREELLGPNHPRVAATLEKYAVLLRQLERRDEAYALENRARAIRAGQGEIRENAKP